MSFHDFFKEAEFNDDDSILKREELNQFKQRISEPLFQEAVESMFMLLRVYHDAASLLINEEVANNVVLMVFQHWLETGRFV